MTRAFYRTYRPQKFSDLIGQDLIRLTLSQSVIEKRIASAYLFSGPRGTGKTTTARILAKAINCTSPDSKRNNGDPCNKCPSCVLLNEGRTLDLIEIDAASHTGVDNIRSLTENIELAPAKLRYRVFIIDEIHMLSKGAFNALLKTLEEPPEHVIFILATTEMHKVPATIGSRCQKFSFRLLKIPEIKEKLLKIAEIEKINIDDESLSLIGESAQGGMRDAESILFQIVSLTGNKVDSKKVQEILGIGGRNKEIQILQELFLGNVDLVLEIIKEMVTLGADVFLLSHNLLNLLRKIIFIKVDQKSIKTLEQEISENDIEKLQNISSLAGLSQIISLMGKIIQSQSLIKSSSLSSLPLELALVDWAVNQNKLNNLSKNNDFVKDNETEQRSDKIDEKELIQKKNKTIKSNEITERMISIKESENKKKPTKKKKMKINASEETSSPQTACNLEEILKKWNNIILNIRLTKPALSSLLKVCSPLRIDDNILVVATPFKFHKEKLNGAENKKVFCEELQKAVGISKVSIIEDKSIEINKPQSGDLLSQVQSLLN